MNEDVLSSVKAFLGWLGCLPWQGIPEDDLSVRDLGYVAGVMSYVAKLGGETSNIFFMFTPNVGEGSHFDEHIFQLG